MGDAQHTLDGTHCAANAGADRTSDDAAHGASDPISLMRTLLSAAHDALGMAGSPRRKQDEQCCRHRR